MYTLLETCLDKLDIFEFLTHVEDGLKDHYDIKVRAVNWTQNAQYVTKIFPKSTNAFFLSWPF